ncbi:N-acetyltransferase, GNAT family [Geotalea daltonii FRC-32]|uniref:N-acetyltransferase, GNAT family n=1 Tax=Geotalea daltonii (strain DSM 22248 / JCM 15807 / FRC-32) TaxID=316067 RepID=B9M3Z5_GEODF|nr:GNAT family N-acetyltransferase [Geotalea daltonii]ACM19638.1 N-acetyltransferase, GNAT family [Geotalea daltonii FRC-32]
MIKDGQIALRSIGEGDLEFLLLLYASTREPEKAMVAWPDEQWDQFMRMQFSLQHAQYMKNYENPSFDVILVNGVPAGRLYVNRKADDCRLIDIALLPEFHGRGIAGSLIGLLLQEADENGTSVSLHVEKNNPVRDYYLRLGFNVAEDKGVYDFMVRPVGGKDRRSGAV